MRCRRRGRGGLADRVGMKEGLNEGGKDRRDGRKKGWNDKWERGRLAVKEEGSEGGSREERKEEKEGKRDNLAVSLDIGGAFDKVRLDILVEKYLRRGHPG